MFYPLTAVARLCDL